MHQPTPTGATAMVRTVPAATLPALPASTALARTSTQVSPAASTASAAVSNRTSPAVMHTVPAEIMRPLSAARSSPKRRTPSARTAPRRSSPRRAACWSRYSPSAVWGKACRRTQSAWI